MWTAVAEEPLRPQLAGPTTAYEVRPQRLGAQLAAAAAFGHAACALPTVLIAEQLPSFCAPVMRSTLSAAEKSPHELPSALPARQIPSPRAPLVESMT